MRTVSLESKQQGFSLTIWEERYMHYWKRRVTWEQDPRQCTMLIPTPHWTVWRIEKEVP